MVSRTHTVAIVGVDAVPVEVEARITNYLKRFVLVGLPDGVVREAKERVRCAIESSGFSFPSNEVIVSLAPAWLPKSGAGFDFAIALSILAADGQIPPESLSGKIFLGELALDGTVKAARGSLAAACYAMKRKRIELFVPKKCEREASLVPEVTTWAAESLIDVVKYLRTGEGLQKVATDSFNLGNVYDGPTFADVVGQHATKRALEIAAAGNHNLLMLGPPGSGKSMLAARLPSILPPLSREEAIEVSKVYSLANQIGTSSKFHQVRPFRAPHHTTSTAGLVGGGPDAQPGEVTLAHRGVLFLDEFAEFKRDVLEALRQPLESKEIVISRAKNRVKLPADSMVIAASNPCPCGRLGSAQQCKCSVSHIERFKRKLSGPILDRIDLTVWVSPVPPSTFQSHEQDTTKGMLERVILAREAQVARYKDPRKTNATMNGVELKQFCIIDSETKKLIERATLKHQLSARGYTRVLKVARTIADIDGAKNICLEHVTEALSYRMSEW